MGTHQGRQVEVVEAQGLSERCLSKGSPTGHDDRAKAVLHRVLLQIWSEAGGSLSRIREYENLSPPQRREVRCWLLSWWLHGNLLREKHLKGLIPLSLVVLDGRSSETGPRTTDSAGHELARRSIARS